MEITFGFGCETSLEPAPVNPLLNGDVRPSFNLEIAFSGVLTVVALERALDVYGVRVVPFNEVRVIAIHRTNEVCKRSEKGWWQAATYRAKSSNDS